MTSPHLCHLQSGLGSVALACGCHLQGRVGHSLTGGRWHTQLHRCHSLPVGPQGSGMACAASVSRLTFYIILHGATVTAKVVDTQHRRSPLVQGGLEIPIEVTVEMDFTDKNKLCLDNYESLVNEEPVDGKFENETRAILREIIDDSGDSGDSDLELEL